MHGMNHTGSINAWGCGASKPAVLQRIVVSKPGGPAARRSARVSSRCAAETRPPERRIEGERTHARIPTNCHHLRPVAG